MGIETVSVTYIMTSLTATSFSHMLRVYNHLITLSETILYATG